MRTLEAQKALQKELCVRRLRATTSPTRHSLCKCCNQFNFQNALTHTNTQIWGSTYPDYNKVQEAASLTPVPIKFLRVRVSVPFHTQRNTRMSMRNEIFTETDLVLFN